MCVYLETTQICLQIQRTVGVRQQVQHPRVMGHALEPHVADVSDRNRKTSLVTRTHRIWTNAERRISAKRKGGYRFAFLFSRRKWKCLSVGHMLEDWSGKVLFWQKTSLYIWLHNWLTRTTQAEANTFGKVQSALRLSCPMDSQAQKTMHCGVKIAQFSTKMKMKKIQKMLQLKTNHLECRASSCFWQEIKGLSLESWKQIEFDNTALMYISLRLLRSKGDAFAFECPNLVSFADSRKTNLHNECKWREADHQQRSCFSCATKKLCHGTLLEDFYMWPPRLRTSEGLCVSESRSYHHGLSRHPAFFTSSFSCTGVGEGLLFGVFTCRKESLWRRWDRLSCTRGEERRTRSLHSWCWCLTSAGQSLLPLCKKGKQEAKHCWPGQKNIYMVSKT